MPQTQSYEPIPAVLTSVNDVRKAVAQVRRAADEGDFERAGSYESAVHIAALEAIASSNAQAGYIAAEALTTADIDFPRWRA